MSNETSLVSSIRVLRLVAGEQTESVFGSLCPSLSGTQEQKSPSAHSGLAPWRARGHAVGECRRRGALGVQSPPVNSSDPFLVSQVQAVIPPSAVG